MKKTDMVVKSNDLTQASYALTLTEQRMIRLAIVVARESQMGISADKPLTIEAKTFANQFGLSLNAAYDALQAAANTLFERQVTLYGIDEKSGKRERIKCRWVSQIHYIDDTATLKFCFAPAIADEIKRQDGKFIKYTLEQLSGVTSAYAIRLYELLIQWRDVGKTPLFKLDEFRGQMGLAEHEYLRMTDFKKGVLDLAVKQINEHTDISATYEQIKSGRAIIGFIFKFKVKKSAIEHKEPSKPKSNKSVDYAIVGMASADIYTLKDIQKYAPEITSEYVISFAKREKLDVTDALKQIKRDYQKPEDFSLEKTN
jgi:plasmid replication initiation protein